MDNQVKGGGVKVERSTSMKSRVEGSKEGSREERSRRMIEGPRSKR